MANLAAPTPEEIAEYEKSVAQPASAALNPIRDLSADEIYELATKDSDHFDLIGEFRRNKDLWGDQNVVQKVADVHNRVKQRGFDVSDIPGPSKVAHTVFDIAKGFGKQAWNYANALVGVPLASAIGEVTGDANRPSFNKELAEEGQRRVMENLSGTEAGMFGVARMGEKLVNKVTGASSNLSPEQKVTDLWKDVGTGDVEEDITKGKGGLMTPIGVNVREDLEAAGKPVRPEEVATLAAGDPASFYTFGKIFQGAGKAIPAPVGAAVDKVAAKAGQVAEVVAGKAVNAIGDLVDLGGRAAKVAGPAVGLIKGGLEAGPLGALAGLKGGEIAAKAGNKISGFGKGIASVGDEIAGKAPITSGAAQLAKDVVGSAPMAAAEIGKGLGFDIGTAALTSEGPKDTQSVGIGAFFGGMGAARRAGGKVISGQIVGPREWGSDKYVPPSGQLDSKFENMHIEATKDAAPAVKTRLNAIRQFLKGANADTDIFLAKDAPSLERVLVESGVTPEQAKTMADQEGFFTANLPGKDGTPRRVILARSVDAAPHEAFHAIQDVLGETANQAIDQIVREEYGPQWETEGQRYAARIGEGDWREVILDATGTGLNYAKEKVAMNVANEYRAATGAEPTPAYVQARAKEIFGQIMDQAVQANPNVDPNAIAQHAWRDVLSPQEATAVADSYLARELAAENFDMVFKNLGASLNNQGLVGRLARVVAGLVRTIGGEPLSPEVKSEIGEIAPRFNVVEAVRNAPSLITPKAQKATPTAKPSVFNEPLLPSPKINAPAADEARAIATEAPNTVVAGASKPTREILGSVAEAIAQQAGVKINYMSAPGEPAAAITSNREARRAIIESFRKMPAEARTLWEKTFFPEKVIKLKGDKYQVMGWAPEVFAANAHKLAEKLVELGVAEASPYPIANNSFTPEGWRQLYADTQKFVQNQMAGRTGAGEPLVVPKNVTEAGFFAPPQRGAVAGLDQIRADFINMLFNFRLPDTARVQSGKMPLNIAAQDVSAATKPGRVEVPVIPRGKYAAPFEGRQIMEVNPLRQQIEAAAQAKGVAMPEFIEAIQRLNLESIKDLQLAPEQPQFRGNTLTLSAGFQPRTAKGQEMVEKGYEFEDFGFFGTRGVRALKDGVTVGDISSASFKSPKVADIDMVWVDEAHQRKGLGEALYRELATKLQEDGVETVTGTAISAAPLKIRRKIFGDFETEHFRKIEDRTIVHVTSKLDPSARFQPKKIEDIAMMSDEEFRQWSSNLGAGKGFTDVAAELGREHSNPDILLAMHDALKEQGKERVKRAIESKDVKQMEDAVAFASKVQFFREAYEAARNVGSMKDFDKSDDTKFIKSVNSSDDNLQKKVLDSGTENADNDASMSTQLQPKKAASKSEFKMKPAKGGFSKAWIMPDGTPVQLGGQWHHEFINESPEVRSKYGLPEDDNTESNRMAALREGFVRLNWADTSGRLTIEARSKDWPRQREAVRNFVERNAEKIDQIQVYLMDDTVQKVENEKLEKVFDLDDLEKPAMIPFLDLDAKRATGDASDRLFQKAVNRASNRGGFKITNNPDAAYWVGPDGKVYEAPDGHEMSAYELNRDGVIEVDLDKLAKDMDRNGVEALYSEMGKRKFLRGYNVNETTIGLEGPGKWEHLPRAQREAIIDAAAERGMSLFYNNKEVGDTGLPEVGAAMFQPKKIAEDYAKRAGIKYNPSTERSNVPESTAKKVADFYDSAADSPDSPEVKKSYEALAKETLDQYRAIEEAGYEIEPWTGEGEPYKSSADMVKDVTENKHLYFLPTEGNFNGKEANPMLKPSGVGDFLINDIFRAVHDFFGHAKEGLQFGPKGEFNAWKVHSEMYSPDAQGALAAETLAQNFWVNYGKHLRRKDGSVPAKGDEDFRPLADRPFAEQKNIVIPDEILNEVRAQFQPRYEEPKTASDAREMARHFLQISYRNSHRGGYNSVTSNKYTTMARRMNDLADTLEAKERENASLTSAQLQPRKGDRAPKMNETEEALARTKSAVLARWEKDGGGDVIDAAREGHIQWEHFGDLIPEAIPSSGADDLPSMTPEILREAGYKSLDLKWGSSFHDPRFTPLFLTDESGRWPLTDTGVQQAFRDGQKSANEIWELSRRNPSPFQRDSSQFQPRRGDEDLFGNKPTFSPKEVGEMSREELMEFFPEAVIPQKDKELIPSAITESPLFKRAGSEEAAVKAFATKLVEFAKSNRTDPMFKAGSEWYDKFTPMLKKEFGADADLMAELLAATSPQTNVETNFAYALDALEGFKSGRFEKTVTKFNQGMDMLANDTWRGWYSKELKNIPNPPKEPTPAAFLEHWIFKHDLKPRQSNGKLYGQHSLPVLQVFARKWLDTSRGPKTLNFVENLLGKGHEATIDLWADRTMRRIGYADKERWRILPKNQAGVSDTDFTFAQKAFRAAAEQLGMKPSALQGALWFAEKQLWANNGWSRLDLGDFRKEMEKVPLLRKGIQQRLTKTKLSDKVKPSETLELIQPRFQPMRMEHIYTIKKEDVGNGVYRTKLESPERKLLVSIATKFGGIGKADIGKKVYRAQSGELVWEGSHPNAPRSTEP